MLQFGILLFGLLTNNAVVAVGWILISMTAWLDADQLTISALALMLFMIAKKFLTVGGVK